MEITTRGFELSNDDALYVFVPGSTQVYKNTDFYIICAVACPLPLEITIYKRSRVLGRTIKEISYAGVPYSIIQERS